MQITLEIDLDETKDVLSDSFGITLPDNTLLGIIKQNGQLLGEVVDGSINDTAARETLIYAVTKTIGMRDWPCYGEKANMEAFYIELARKLKPIGGTLEGYSGELNEFDQAQYEQLGII